MPNWHVALLPVWAVTAWVITAGNIVQTKDSPSVVVYIGFRSMSLESAGSVCWQRLLTTSAGRKSTSQAAGNNMRDYQGHPWVIFGATGTRTLPKPVPVTAGTSTGASRVRRG
ncbi:hypothetical protein EDB83DRAFT_2315865 [Lactarius deliciosus]|nr:hypothetical protein EDB83DRAFT_2315865 [Lactarius deliciosus]